MKANVIASGRYRGAAQFGAFGASPGAVRADAYQGHWLWATHVRAGYSWRRNEWVVKYSLFITAKSITAEAKIRFLDKAEKRRMDFGIKVDLR
jgi:hypothetical protein